LILIQRGLRIHNPINQMSVLQKKNHKGRIKFHFNSSQSLIYNKFALIAAEAGRITKSEIMAVELAIKRILKDTSTPIQGIKNKAMLRIHPHLNLTKKSLGVRMGKGKGSIYTQFTRVRPGAILIE
jgi:ribosomal protein L16